jgi:hypothetical protein
MFQSLRQPEYIHVLLNPLPIYGLAMGVLGLGVSLVLRSGTAQRVSLLLVLAAAGSAWPVSVYGERGYDRVYAMADSDGQAWLKAHRQRAERLVYVFAGLALLALAGIVGSLKWPRLAFALAAATLLLSLAALGVGGWIAYAGGKIRHREFRDEPPPKEQGESFLESSPTKAASRVV